MNIVDRFVEYAKMDTQSNPKSNTVPTKKLGKFTCEAIKRNGN